MAQRRLTALIESRYSGAGVDAAQRDLKGLGQSGAQASQGLGKASAASGALFKTIGGLVSAGIVLQLGRQAAQMAKAAVEAASRVEEMDSKFGVVFGSSAPMAKQALADLGAEVNRSRYDLEEMGAAVQDLFVPLGFTRAKAAELSIQLVRLAVDVSSFNDTLAPDTLRDFQAALVGETESVRKYGIVLSESVVKQELQRMGAEDLTGAALEMAKTQARLNLIVAGTSDAQGDAARTAGSYANVSRGLEAAIQDLTVAFGQGLIPAAKDSKMALMELAQSLIEPANAWALLMQAYNRGIVSFGEADAMFWRLILTGKTSAAVITDLTRRIEEQDAEMARAGWTSSRYNNLTREGTKSVEGLDGALDKQVITVNDATEAWGKMNEKARDYIPLAYRMETLAEAVAAGISGDLQQAMEGYLSTTEDINQEHADLQGQLDDLLNRGWSPTSEKVLELQGRLDELKAKEQEAGEALAEATAQMIYQQAAAGLDAGASLELARAMGILSEQDYAVSKTLQDLRMSFDDNADGMIGASEGAREFAGQVADIYEAVSNLQAQDVPITFESIQTELEKIDLQKTADEMNAAKLAADQAAQPLDTAASGLALVGEKAEGSRVPIENFESGVASVDSAAALAKTPVDNLAGSVDTLGGKASSTTGLVDNLASAINNLPSVKYIDIIYRVTGSVPGLQHGGPMGFGEVAVVGEAGPEIFVAPASGRIIPHGQAGGRAGRSYGTRGGDTWNFTTNVYSAAAAAMLIAEVQRMRRRRLNTSMGG